MFEKLSHIAWNLYTIEFILSICFLAIIALLFLFSIFCLFLKTKDKTKDNLEEEKDGQKETK